MNWNALPGGFDFSHYQGAIDWGRIAARQPAFVVLKATERMAVDPAFDRNRREAAGRQIPWLPYPFLRQDDDDKVIRHFADVVAQPGVPPALDWEASGVTPWVVDAWVRGSEAVQARTPLAYWGLNPPGPPPSSLARCPRWFPEYPGLATAPPRLPMWNGSANPDWRQCWLIWQWSDNGRVDGVSGPVDLDRLACPAADFLQWYKTGLLPAHAPPPAAPLAPTAFGRNLRLNTIGDDVLQLQKALVANGYAIVADGEFGRQTWRALIAFQKARGLAADGIAGERTSAALGLVPPPPR